MARCKSGKIKSCSDLLIRNDVNVNEKNKEFLSPLHVAVDNQNADLIEMLLKNGAKVKLGKIAFENKNNTEFANIFLKLEHFMFHFHFVCWN